MILLSAVLVAIMMFSLVYSHIKKAMLSQCIIIANLLIFLITSLFLHFNLHLGEILLQDLGFKPIYLLTWEKPYTLFTTLYLHGGIFHILLNMLVLLFLGIPFERRVGALRFGVVYFVSGFFGTILFSLCNLYTPLARYPVIGASGAIFGVLGAFALLYPFDEVPMFLGFFMIPNLPVYLVALVLASIQLVYLGFQARTNIAYMAHVGGLVTGIFSAPALRYRAREKEPIKYSLLKQLAITDKLKDILSKIESEENADVRSAWIVHFLEHANCPRCGGKLKARKGGAICGCGFKVKYQLQFPRKQR